MFSRTRRTVGPSDQRAEDAIAFHDDQVGVPCQVRVVTPGLALVLALILAGLVHLSQSSPTPVAFALCDKFNIRVQALVCSGDARTYYACNADGTFAIWHPHSSYARVGGAQGRDIGNAAFAPDGSKLAVTDSKGVISLWDLATWRLQARILPRTGIVKALVFSRDGAILASSDDSGVRLWAARMANPRAGPRLELRGVSSLAFAPDGRTLAVGMKDGAVRLWDSVLGSRGARFQAHASWTKELAFSKDGRVLATSSPRERIVRLWVVNEGRLLKEFDGRSVIQAVAFAPGDRELATTGLDGTVRLWEVATGDSRGVVLEGDGPVSALAFSADGTTLACGGIGTIRLYRLDASSPRASR